MEKTLVGLAIETTLLHKGKPFFDKVERRFSEKYQCDIIDAYEHPLYLNEILKEVFGDSHLEVVRSIEGFLTDFRDEQPIWQFINKINTQ